MTGYVYAVKSGDAVKIGWARIPERRVAELNVGSASRHELIGYVAGTREQEAECHRLLSPHRIRGEWFDATARTVAAFVGMLPKKPARKCLSGRRVPLKGAGKFLASARGLTNNLAAALGITHGAISQWRRVPAERVLEVERITGVSRHDIRPDIYPPSTSPGHVSTPSTAPDTAKEAA